MPFFRIKFLNDCAFVSFYSAAFPASEPRRETCEHFPLKQSTALNGDRTTTIAPAEQGAIVIKGPAAAQAHQFLDFLLSPEIREQLPERGLKAP